MTDLQSWGFAPFFEHQLDPTENAARVVESSRGHLQLITPAGERDGVLAGRLRLAAEETGVELPTVGDWVVFETNAGDGPLRVLRTLERRSRFARRAPGGREQVQIVAANVDTVWLATSLNEDLNLRRIERYLAAIWESGATPCVLLTKADLHADPEAARAEVARLAAGVDVWTLSSLRGDGIAELRTRIPAGHTAAVVGSSGVGKSTLVNALLGQEHLATGGIRNDGKGRHTTTHRELVPLPGGGLLLDTPGMREFQLWGVEEGVGRVFADIETLKARCRFTDCRHEGEPGCAVREALASGELSEERLASFDKLEREAAFQRRRADKALMSEERKKWKRLHKAYRARDRLKGR